MTDRSPPGTAWWIRPALIASLVSGASIGLTALVPAETYIGEWRVEYSISTEQYLILASSAASLICGALLGGLGTSPEPAPTRDSVAFDKMLSLASPWLFRLTVLGYVSFVVAGATRGISASDLLEAVQGGDVESGYIEKTLGTIPGLTTLTQVGMLSVIVSLYSFCSTRRGYEVRRVVAVLLLAVARSFFLTERLAIIEVLLPILVVIATPFGRNLMRESTRRLLPLVVVPTAFGLFFVFEYTRSWQSYSLTYGGSVWDFMVLRFAGYYATAYNNSSLLLDFPPPTTHLLHYVAQVVWSAPGVSNLELERTINQFDFQDYYEALLAEHGNPEFNNPGGFGSVVFDLGSVGALVFFLIAGLIGGRLFRLVRERSAAGLILYPLYFVGLVETPRYIYWTQGRVLPSLLAAAVFLILLEKRRRDPKTSQERTEKAYL